MFDVATFLMRWLFLSNLVRDVAEIQTLPFQPYQPVTPPPPPPSAQLARQWHEEAWKDHCLRGILSYPPGTQRVLAMDALRVELVQELCQKLKQADAIDQHLMANRHHHHHHHQTEALPNTTAEEASTSTDEDEDPFLDADVEIVRSFGKASSDEEDDELDEVDEDTAAASVSTDHHERRRARLVISRTGANVLDTDSEATKTTSNAPELSRVQQEAVPIPPSGQEIQTASQSLGNVRDYLPQLVSAVLKSPPAMEPHLANPIQKLRQLLLQQCRQDPSWGIELCWLLEAEVGRAWKTLFEHRQQTGRRLIVVLPAEKAAVLAKIGTEKRETFDLLQDAEQSTAYGYTMEPAHEIGEYHSDMTTTSENPTRLPSSLSLRRCSHFGDTMHFIDRLTQISLDLRMVPTLQRDTYLREQLGELNRRIRRRMVTHGDVSIDVEDNRGCYDWPLIDDLRVDMLKYSVHFPLVPQTGVWPTGGSTPRDDNASSDEPLLTPQVVRVLNLVVPETRILASRERCPYLVHLEVADTGLEGSDARLYASGATGLGSTIEEALSTGNGAWTRTDSLRQMVQYQVPPELLDNNYNGKSRSSVKDRSLFRGGSQADEFYYQDGESTGYGFPDPYEAVRQQEYERLHQQMQAPQVVPQPRPVGIEQPTVSMGAELLDKVFGRPWNETCELIRQSSPYGQVKGWRLASFIMKAGEDIRREALVMQIISKLQTYFNDEIPEAHRPFMRPYTIMCVGGDAGLLECLTDAKSIDEVKKQTDNFESLRDYFERAYGPPNRRYGPPSPFLPPLLSQNGRISFEHAQDNFLRSLVGYSLVCYILQIKDRHNGNILLDRAGHIVHIDFGFVLGDTPKTAKVPIFSERAPFKLSQEFWEVLGGWNLQQGGLGVRFCKMFELAFECASAHSDEIASLVEATMLALDSNYRVARDIANGVRHRLRMRGSPGSVEQKSFVMDLVNTALTSWGTSIYDLLQKSINGYQ